MLAGPTAPEERLALELDRVLTRLSALGPQRLVRPGADGGTPADRVRAVLSRIAEAAARAEGEPSRAVPELAAHALGDQLVVLTGDLRRAAADRAARGADDAGVPLARAADELVALRRAL